MGEPYRTGRKGLMLRVQRIATSTFRDWRPFRSDWQPSIPDRIRAKRKIAEMREALDAWEQSL